MCKYHYVKKDGLEKQAMRNMDKSDVFVFHPATESVWRSEDVQNTKGNSEYIAPGHHKPMRIRIAYRDEYDGRRNRIFKRAITIEELAPGLWQGTVVNKGIKTGDWFWNEKLFSQPLFISDIIKMPSGARKRYSTNPINFVIRDAIKSIGKSKRSKAA